LNPDTVIKTTMAILDPKTLETIDGKVLSVEKTTSANRSPGDRRPDNSVLAAMT
jgi:hypothetical protein